MGVLSIQSTNSRQSAAFRSDHGPRKSIEYRHPGSGTNTLQDISEKPDFAGIDKNRSILGGKNAFSRPSLPIRVYRQHIIAGGNHIVQINMDSAGPGPTVHKIHVSKGRHRASSSWVSWWHVTLWRQVWLAFGLSLAVRCRLCFACLPPGRAIHFAM